jgi:hypothetical protein
MPALKHDSTFSAGNRYPGNLSSILEAPFLSEHYSGTSKHVNPIDKREPSRFERKGARTHANNRRLNSPHEGLMEEDKHPGVHEQGPKPTVS